jgi:hypothetical protein
MTLMCALVGCLFPGVGYDQVLARAFGIPGLRFWPGPVPTASQAPAIGPFPALGQHTEAVRAEFETPRLRGRPPERSHRRTEVLRPERLCDRAVLAVAYVAVCWVVVGGVGRGWGCVSVSGS